ncbi:MAG TPA: hypothetical protein VK356_12530 [Thermomicrobiales bacterium]|nr:hypothetical protein [Thermomicrobiales bacterium]
MEQELRRMFEVKETEMIVPPTLSPELRNRIGRLRMLMGGLIAAAALAVVLGGFVGVRSLSSDDALPPANPDSKENPFVGTWTTTNVDGGTRTMVIRASGEDAYEITVHNHLAQVCSGAPSTLTGTGQLLGSKSLFIRSPQITCDDGSEPKLEDDLPPPEELLRGLSFEHDPEADILTNYSPLERRRIGGNDQAIYDGVTLVWRRAVAESRVGDVSGWITYGDKGGIWARDLTSPDDPADRIRLSSAPGTPIGWSRDGLKLLVERDMGGTDGLNEAELFVLSSEGTETRLTDADGGTGGGSFSPDATAVVYARTRECWWRSGGCGKDASSAIYVVDAEGGSPRVLLTSGSRRYPDDCGTHTCMPGRFETALQEPKWSPDGSQIAYFDGMFDWGHSLRVMDRDGTNSRVVVENSETLGGGHVDGLEWSPDGSQLAFSIEGRLYVVGVDGSGFRLVTDVGGRPYWSPDGSHIAYTRDLEASEGGGSLEIVRLDDLQVQNFGDGGSGPWTSEVEWSANPKAVDPPDG